MDVLAGFFDILKMIGDFLSSIIHGLQAIVEAFSIIGGVNQFASSWMPSFIFGIFISGFTLSIVIRLVK